MENVVEQKMSIYINSIEKSLKDENWASALSLSLMLPDMCSKMEYSDLKYVGDRYRKWFDIYLSDTYNNWQIMMTAHDFYALRCSYLHAGETDISENKQRIVIDEFKFVAPTVTNGNYSGYHRIKIMKNMVLRVDLFCLEICEAVQKWIENNKNNNEIKKKASKIIEIDNNSMTYKGVRFM